MSLKSLIRAFAAVCGPENVFSEEADRLTYAYDAAPLESVMPALVVRSS